MAPTTRKMAYPAADAVPSAAAAIPPPETADRSLETVDTPSVLVEFLPATAATENLATAAATENLDTAAATEDLDPAATGDLDLAATVQRPSRRFALQNGINCLLISDPDVTKVAVSLSVSVGYFHEPQDLQGLSHLLQWVVFYGSGNDKSSDNFSKYILQNGGSCRLSISLDKTIFSFDVSCDASSVALEYADIVAWEKAIKSGDKECQCAMTQLQKHLTSENHPYRNFSYESLRSSGADALKRKPNIREELLKWHNTHCSANLMDLVVYGQETLDKMQEVIQNKFSILVNNDRPQPPAPGHPCRDKHVKILVKVVPTKGGHSVKIQWPLMRENLDEISASRYVTHTLGYKGEGSIFSILEKLGWCSDVKTDERICSSEISFLTVSIDLTDSGKGHFEDVSAIVLNHVKMMRRQGPRKSLFEQLKNNCVTQFKHGDNDHIKHVVTISSNMKFFSTGDHMINSAIPWSYSKNAIKKIVDKLVAENVRIFWESNIFEGQTNSTEPYFGTKYSVELIDLRIIKEWMSNAPKEDMLLPRVKPTKDLITTGRVKDVKVPAKRSKATVTHNYDKASVSCVTQITTTEIELKTGSAAQKQVPQRVLDVVNTEQKSDLVQRKANVCIIYDERMAKHKPLHDHVENPSRIKAIYERLEKDGLLKRCTVYGSEEVKLSDLTDFHTDPYILRILGAEKLSGKVNKNDMYYNKGTKDAISLAAGGAIKACRMVASGIHDHAFAIVRPPGHHAKANEEGGFCFLNNAGVGANYLHKKHNKNKILILDWDIHFADGTESLFREDKNVMLISLHRYPYFPEIHGGGYGDARNIGSGNGVGYNCNICWTEKGVQDDDLYAVFDYIVLPLVQQFNPDVILLSGGFDAALNDLIGDCSITTTGYATALHKLLQLKKSLVIILEGGYNIEVLGECCSSCVRVLSGDTSEGQNTSTYNPLESTWKTILELRDLLKEHWSNLSTDIPTDILARIRTKEENEKPAVLPPKTKTKPARPRKRR